MNNVPTAEATFTSTLNSIDGHIERLQKINANLPELYQRMSHGAPTDAGKALAEGRPDPTTGILARLLKANEELHQLISGIEEGLLRLNSLAGDR